MTTPDISKAKNPDLAASMEAMQHAAAMARQIAIQTNTGIVVFENGKIVHRTAAELQAEMQKRELRAVRK